MNKKTIHSIFLLLVTTFSLFFILPINNAWAPCKPDGACSCGPCAGFAGACSAGCACISTAETGTSDKPETTMGHITEEFKKHRIWMVEVFFRDPKPNDPPGLLGAMKLMTSQLVTTGVQQVQIIGTFFDAKHQLETQRLFQQMTARAHKDYHPNEELCEFGTVTRSLSSSSRNATLTASAISKRSVDRQLLAKYTVGTESPRSDQESRLKQFILKYCDQKDNAKNLDLLCKKSENQKELFNKDVNYTTTIGAPLTLDLDFSKKGTKKTDDEDSIFALSANLFAHTLMPVVPVGVLITKNKKASYAGGAKDYADNRALIAKRSVASNSFAAIASLKSKGGDEAKPFIYALIKEMGSKTGEGSLSSDEIKDLIGEHPSYYAQMEILTKKLYQHPNFYTDLYDKPANVLRKDVAMQAAELMQKRDIFRSLLRSEAVMAVMLETALVEREKKIENTANPSKESGAPRGELKK